jgi:competence protein ComEA
MEVSMKRFSQRLSVLLAFLSTLMLSSALMSSSVYAAESVDKSPKATKALVKQQTININTADAAALTLLKGVGDKKAQAIIAYRDEHGAFQSVEELAEVKGIGDAIVNANRDIILLK